MLLVPWKDDQFGKCDNSTTLHCHGLLKFYHVKRCQASNVSVQVLEAMENLVLILVCLVQLQVQAEAPHNITEVMLKSNLLYDEALLNKVLLLAFVNSQYRSCFKKQGKCGFQPENNCVTQRI